MGLIRKACLQSGVGDAEVMIAQEPQGTMKLDDAGEGFRRQAGRAKENTPGSPLTNAVHVRDICDTQSSTRGVQGADDIPALESNFKVTLGITFADETYQSFNKLIVVRRWNAKRLQIRACVQSRVTEQTAIPQREGFQLQNFLEIARS